MERGSKLVVVALAALLVISLIFAYQVTVSKQSEINRYKEIEKSLNEKNADIESQLAQMDKEKRKIADKMSVIQKDIDKISAERDEWKNKYEIVKTEKEELMAKVKSAPVVTEKFVEFKPALAEDDYWADVLQQKAALEVKVGQLNKAIEDNLGQLAEIKKAKSDLELELTSLKQSKDDMERDLQYNKQLVSNLSRDLVGEKTDKATVLNQINKIKQENSALRRQVKDLSAAKLNLEKGLSKLEEDKNKLAERISLTEQTLQGRTNELTAIKQDLDAMLGKESKSEAQQSNAVQLPPIIVRPGTESEMAEQPAGQTQEKSGRILSLNETNNFVIISLGDDKGVKVGDIFRVFRENKHIATIEVIQTRKDIAAADIKFSNQKIAVGDSVRTP